MFSQKLVRLLCVYCFLLSPLVWGQTASLEHVLRDLQQVRKINSLSMSPDGRWLTWNQGLPGTETGNEAVLLDTSHPDSAPVQISVPNSTVETHNERVAWAPDSRSFAFLSKPGLSGQYQIYAASVADLYAKKLTDLHGFLQDLRWAPDGSRLSFLYAENGGGAGPLSAQAARVGEVDEQLHNQRISLMPAAGGGAVEQVTPADVNVYEYDWSPDGTQFAFVGAPGPADNNWWIAKLYGMALNGGRLRVLFSPRNDQQIAVPRWSPRGNEIAFVAGLMSDEGATGGDVYLVPAAGGAARNVTSGGNFSASSLEWLRDGSLLFTAAQEGGGAIYRMDHAASRAGLIWKGDNQVRLDDAADLTMSADGTQSAMVQSTWAHPPEVWIGPPGKWSQVTHLNAGQQPHWGKAESIQWTNGPHHVQGWLLYPESYDPQKKYPLVVSVHGGPSSERAPGWPTAHFDMSVLSAFGYFVFFPNPRGSYGQGEAFTKANVKDFGGGDLGDVMGGIDAVMKKVPVDGHRLGVTGWSYGGFMTMWTVTQTNRFRAAVAGAGIADWLSYYGENSIDEWMIPFFGASVYDDPAVYAKSSPITYIKRVKTPTLILVGERDAECPAPQSFEFWHALKALGVPTRLVVYPGEGHSFDKPQDDLDRTLRSIEWFNKYLN